MRYSPEICFGCRTCELVCSLSHEGACSPSTPRLLPIARGASIEIEFTDECDECARCSRYCPSGAIEKGGRGGRGRARERGGTP